MLIYSCGVAYGVENHLGELALIAAWRGQPAQVSLESALNSAFKAVTFKDLLQTPS